MPSNLIHVLTAYNYNPDGSDGYFVGNIAPDCIFDREIKDKQHFRTSSDHNADLTAYVRGLDLNNPFCLGVALHLYTDMLWDAGPMQNHRDSYKGTRWFIDYRAEITASSRNIYLRKAYIRGIWNRMEMCGTDKYNALPEFPAVLIREFLDKFQYNTNVDFCKPSGFFTPSVTDNFCDNAAEKFKDWIKTI